MTNLAADTTPPADRASRSAILPGSASGLRPDDLHRIAVAIDVEVAPSTRATYASGWRSWETWCRRRELVPLPADPDALAVYLTERAESGLCNGSHSESHRLRRARPAAMQASLRPAAAARSRIAAQTRHSDLTTLYDHYIRPSVNVMSEPAKINGLAMSGFALNAEQLLEQYAELTRKYDPADRYEATLTLSVLTNCWELYKHLIDKKATRELGSLRDYIVAMLLEDDVTVTCPSPAAATRRRSSCIFGTP